MNEADIYFVKFPADIKFLGQSFDLNVLGLGAYILSERAGCDIRTFEYHGIIEAGPRPGQAEGAKAHLWSAMQKAR